MRSFSAGLAAYCALFLAGTTLLADDWPPDPSTNAQFSTPGPGSGSALRSGAYAAAPIAYDTNNESLMDRLDSLEAEVMELRADKGSGSGGSSSSGTGPVMPGHSASKMKVVGRVHADMWNHPHSTPGVNQIETGDPLISPQDRLGFRRVRFGVRGTLPANMEYRIEMEFASGVRTEFRDVWLGWNDLPVVQTLLVGNQKRPYGLDHLNSSRYNVFLERPFVVESFNQDARRLGIEAYGVSDDQRWNWRYGVFVPRLLQDEGQYISDHWQLEGAGRLANTIWYDECSGGRGYAHWAVSGVVAHPDGTTDGDSDPIGIDRSQNDARFRTRPEARTVSRWLDTGRIAGADWYQLLGLEGVVNVGPVQVVGEFQNIWLQRDPGFGPDIRLDGAYFYVSYFLTGEHMVWSRRAGTLGRVKPFENFFLVDRCSGGVGHGLGAWQIAARYSYADFNDDNIFGGRGESFTFGLNWYWTPYARMQFNYILGDIENRNVGTVAAPNLVSGDYGIIGVRAMVDF